MIAIRLFVVLFLALPDMPLMAGMVQPAPGGGGLAGLRPRVIVSTDIRGTDPDDLQSMVHSISGVTCRVDPIGRLAPW